MLTRLFLPLSLALFAFSITTANAAGKMNVLFIAVDDLRPELACYGSESAYTPNIDALASSSLTFNRAYCQSPLCSPSRTSVLTGLRPDTTGVHDLKKYFRDTDPTIVTLPQLFKQNGYHTRSIGKIYHGINGPLADHPQSWSEPPVTGKDLAPTPDGTPRQPHGLPYESPDVADDQLPDGQIADIASAALRENKDRPFFLAVGFAKPHLPFVAPEKYWRRFRETSVPLASNPHLPKDAPEFATNNSGELRQYIGIPKTGPLSEEQQRHLKEGYLASVAYMDAQLGKVLNELDRLELRKNTVIIFWGDHGYQLGEHGTWTKHTVWENSARVPLLLAEPGGKASGKKTDALVELIDIYPTLAEMCGLSAPPTLEGTSMVPLLDNPTRPWKTGTFIDWRKNIPGVGPGIGRSIRTDRYRMVEWGGRDRETSKTYELYDHQTDPAENINIAINPENAAIIEQLTKQLNAGWKAARPAKD